MIHIASFLISFGFVTIQSSSHEQSPDHLQFDHRVSA